MFCKSCGSDLGQQSPNFCSRCGAPTSLPAQASPIASSASAQEPQLQPDGANVPVPVLAPMEVTPQENIPSWVPAQDRPGVNPALVIGIGTLIFVLVLAGLWWTLGQKWGDILAQEPVVEAVVEIATPQPVLPEPASQAPEPMEKPLMEVSPVAVDTPIPVQEAEEPPAKTVEAAKPVDPASGKVKTKPIRRPVNPFWLDDLRHELAYCDGSFFCREKVRWKYCEGRWNSVPECAVSKRN